MTDIKYNNTGDIIGYKDIDFAFSKKDRNLKYYPFDRDCFIRSIKVFDMISFNHVYRNRKSFIATINNFSHKKEISNYVLGNWFKKSHINPKYIIGEDDNPIIYFNKLTDDEIVHQLTKNEAIKIKRIITKKFSHNNFPILIFKTEFEYKNFLNNLQEGFVITRYYLDNFNDLYKINLNGYFKFVFNNKSEEVNDSDTLIERNSNNDSLVEIILHELTLIDLMEICSKWNTMIIERKIRDCNEDHLPLYLILAMRILKKIISFDELKEIIEKKLKEL